MEHTRRPPSPGLYTPSDIEGWTRQPRRTLQGWGDAGVILAAPDIVHGGKGVHRRFPVAEVAVAVLVSPISDAGWPIGRLVPLGEYCGRPSCSHQVWRRRRRSRPRAGRERTRRLYRADAGARMTAHIRTICRSALSRSGGH
jgi:hypothetical protein